MAKELKNDLECLIYCLKDCKGKLRNLSLKQSVSNIADKPTAA